MKFITAFVLALCLLSPAAQAETTLFGLTLGKSTLEEVQKTYTLHGKSASAKWLDGWNYYRVTGNQFNVPQLKEATLYFAGDQVLETISFYFPPSLEQYIALRAEMDKQYPRIKMAPYVSEPLLRDKTEYQNTTTKVRLDHSDYGTWLIFTDLKYFEAAQKIKAQHKAQQALPPQKEPQT